MGSIVGKGLPLIAAALGALLMLLSDRPEIWPGTSAGWKRSSSVEAFPGNDASGEQGGGGLHGEDGCPGRQSHGDDAEGDVQVKEKVWTQKDTRRRCKGDEIAVVDWVWSGGLTSDSMVVKARLSCAIVSAEYVVAKVEEVVETTANMNAEKQELWYTAESVGDYGMATIILDGLKPLTKYKYFVWVSNSKEEETEPPKRAIDRSGQFTTTGLDGEPFSFEFGFASCADNHSNSVIFDVIRNHDPLFFAHTGDLHYGNVEANDPLVFHSMYDQVMSNPRQRQFFGNVSIVYMFDDHDFGPNNSHKGSPGRESSLSAYLESVPSYPLAAYSTGQRRNNGNRKGDTEKKKELPSVYFSFAIGRVKFLVTDTSSSKIPKQTALGKEQLEWLKKELIAANESHEFIFWICTMPWVTPQSKWGAFQAEQDEIASVIKSHHIHEKLILLSGDAHMLALDDGENSAGGMPVFQAAALDAKPTCKGGPYSHGIYPGRGQYGWIKVVDHGKMKEKNVNNEAKKGEKEEEGICVIFSGRRIVDFETGDEVELLHYDTCNPERNSPRQPYVPSPKWVEKIWKEWKKQLPEAVMVYFDGFTVSIGMVMNQYIVPGIAGVCIGGFLAVQSRMSSA